MKQAGQKSVLLGMSGGLDSTYSARLLLAAGYRVMGAVLVFSKETDVQAARIAADEVGIELLEIPVEEAFATEVIARFAADYAQGRTPNPCVICNRHVKMAKLYETAKANGYDYFATGHYADTLKIGDRYAIRTAKDLKKDQSYMLWGLSQEMLSMLLLPLADKEKSDVKQDALAVSLSVAQKKESQDICFIPDGDYVGYLRRYAEKTGDEALIAAFEEGNFLSKEGKVLGRHRGIVNYTVGQRKHLGIALGYPAFVTAIDPIAKTVTLSDKSGTLSERFGVDDLVFQSLFEKSEGEIRAEVKIRYAARPAACTVTFFDGRALVTLDQPQASIAKGQSAVFYKDGVILFGGRISS